MCVSLSRFVYVPLCVDLKICKFKRPLICQAPPEAQGAPIARAAEMSVLRFPPTPASPNSLPTPFR